MSRRRITSLATTLALAGGLSAIAAAPPALAASGTFTQPAPISVVHEDDDEAFATTGTDLVVPDGGGASSTLTLSAPANATTTYISLSAHVEHASMDDLDLVLVAPDGRAATLASDVGGNTSVRGWLTFTHTFPAFQDDSVGGSAGAPIDFDTSPGDVDAFPGTAPASLGSLGGSPVSGTWTLYAYDDLAGNTGTVSAWELDVMFGLPATPSPSLLTVRGMPRGATDVDLVLDDVSGSIADTELLLESPGGRYAHVLSDTADDDPLKDVDLILDDEAAATIPQDSTPVSGAYRPRNYVDTKVAVQSEPVGGIETLELDARLSVFDGGNPNGSWKLWVFQEACCAAVTIGSWSLEITADDPPAPPTPPSSGATDTTAPVLSDVQLTPGRLPTGVGARLRVASTETAKLVGMVQRKKDGDWKRVGTKTWSVRPGANTRVFYGKTAQGRLTSGQYRVLLAATDPAGNTSAEVRRRFRVDRG